MFIDSKYRKRGLGLKLLQEIENYGIKSGIKSIRATAQKKNTSYKKFLERSGYKFKSSNPNLMIKRFN